MSQPLAPPSAVDALDAAQDHLGTAITAYGWALNDEAGTVGPRGPRARAEMRRSRAWARIERARLLDLLGRPAEAGRLRARAADDLTPLSAAA